MYVKKLRSAAPAAIAILLALAALPAHADTRTTSFTTYLHVGPGRQYAVVDEVPTRTEVPVAGCQGDWCQIRYGAVLGWVEGRMLVKSPPTGQAAAATLGECVDFARTGWPDSGDAERLCLPKPVGAPATR